MGKRRGVAIGASRNQGYDALLRRAGVRVDARSHVMTDEGREEKY